MARGCDMFPSSRVFLVWEAFSSLATLIVFLYPSLVQYKLFPIQSTEIPSTLSSSVKETAVRNQFKIQFEHQATSLSWKSQRWQPSLPDLWAQEGILHNSCVSIDDPITKIVNVMINLPNRSMTISKKVAFIWKKVFEVEGEGFWGLSTNHHFPEWLHPWPLPHVRSSMAWRRRQRLLRKMMRSASAVTGIWMYLL